MVAWIWSGALVVFLGGLSALWPSPRRRPARHPGRRRPRRPRGARLGVDGPLVIVVVLAIAVLLGAAPLRSRCPDEATESAAPAGLEAARDAKYREIRDAELDYRTGQLSKADWRAVAGP